MKAVRRVPPIYLVVQVVEGHPLPPEVKVTQSGQLFYDDWTDFPPHLHWNDWIVCEEDGDGDVIVYTNDDFHKHFYLLAE